MIMEIGITAGEIWHYLDREGQVNLSDLVKNIEKPRELVLMSVGWLAREGHVVLNMKGSEYTIFLRSKDEPKIEQ